MPPNRDKPEQEETERGFGNSHTDDGKPLTNAFVERCLDGRFYAANLLHGLPKAIVAGDSCKDGEDEEKDEGHNVGVVIDAVRREANNASVEPEQQEKEHKCGHNPHHTYRPGGIPFKAHLVVKRRGTLPMPQVETVGGRALQPLVFAEGERGMAMRR